MNSLFSQERYSSLFTAVLFTRINKVILFIAILTLLHTEIINDTAAAPPSSDQLFTYNDSPQQGEVDFPQWLSVLERHLIHDLPDGDISDKKLNRKHLKQWYKFLESIKNIPPHQQLKAVNKYANKKKYILDIINYGMEEYWAIVKEFLYNNGDCEDYAITKFFSLRWLGFSNDDLRIVVLQDTNLRIPHAVLAVYLNNDIFILDNQVSGVLSHREIVHYVPIYSINEKSWWIHLPPI